MLEEAEASKKEIENQYKDALKQLEKFQEAEEERTTEEAEARKLAAVDAIISKEILFGTTRRRLPRMLELRNSPHGMR